MNLSILSRRTESISSGRPKSWSTVLQAGLTIAALAVFTILVLIVTPLGSVEDWDSMSVLWVGGAMFACLLLALGSGRTRISSARQAAFVLWGFLLLSEALFSRLNTVDSTFAGKMSMAAYGEAILWVLCCFALIPLFLGSPLPIQRSFQGSYRWVMCFGFVCLLSCVYSPRPAFSAAWALKLLLVILLLHLCSAYMKGLEDIDAFLQITLWSLALLVIYVLLQAYFSGGLFDKDGRMVKSNGLSASAGTLLLLCFTLYSPARVWALRKAVIFVSFVSFIIMVVAGGKAGIVAGIISGILFFALRKGLGSAATFLGGVLVVGFLAIMLSPMSRYLENYVQDDQAATLTGRIDLWGVALPAVLQKPIIGHGYVSSAFISLQVNGIPWEAGHMHNGFLEALYDNGIIGFILILAIQIVIIRNLLHIIRHSAPDHYTYQIGVGCFAVYVNLLINGMANASFAGKAWHPFMLLLALVVVSDKLAEYLEKKGASGTLVG